MESEHEYASSWIKGKPVHLEAKGSSEVAGSQRGLKSFLSVLGQGRSYRGLLYSILQLPIGIAAFTVAIVLPAVVLALLLSPLAYEVSLRMYDFNLFPTTWNWTWNGKLPNLEPYQQSWVVGGIGVLFALLLPLTLRVLGRFYASWLQEIAGSDRLHTNEQPASVSQYEESPQEQYPDAHQLRLVSGLNGGRPDPKDSATRAEMMQLINKL
ncbi:hypothetical protein GCM10010911_17290 [Paenibacillus nasutitermitis]|uniref:Putative sensor domain-containing protein n=2 Tax=Paenibacillus nasutitermitis TaxID=1652958 RepID=A0A916YTE7_9BACL|nr:hypothetical protein GCM10010911_17290 [Paenibacillus nasutitermitis]